MKKYTSLFVILWLLVGFPTFANFSLQKLQVNYQTTPLGTDLPIPQFSWQMKASDTQKGYLQTAYQIIVTDEKNTIVWDSKPVKSGISHAIQYAGKTLQPTTKYTWKLLVWDNFGKMASAYSWFETGLMNPKIEAWSGAKWIGGDNNDLVLYSHYLSVYKLQFALQLEQASNSTKAAFIFGANDSRLMNKNLNLMGQQNQTNEGYIALELDISGLNNSSDGLAKFHIYRVGYAPTDKVNEPFKSVNIPLSVINQANKYSKHSIYATCNFGIFEFFIDGTDEPHRLKDSSSEPVSRFSPRGINLNPIGSGNNYISFPMLADIGFKVDANQTAFFSDIQIKNFRLPANTLFSEDLRQSPYQSIFQSPQIAIEENSYRVKGNTFFTVNPSKNAAPMLRSTFDIAPKPIKKARLYVTARGIYEVYLNGQRVSNDFFNPGLTQYNKHQMYQTYDITAALGKGKNAIGAWLSEGWWSGNITYSGENWNFFGDRQSFLSKLVITYTDGQEQVITSNTKDWQIFTDGPVRYGSFFQGEVYDANKEALIKNWATASYQPLHWKPVVEVPLEGTSYNEGNKQNALNYNDFQLIGQIGENATLVKTLAAQSVEEVRPHIFVYDMGQNMVGFPSISIKNGKKGQIINLRYAEIKYPHLPDYKGNEGMVMMENIRAALTQDQYVLKGGNEVIQPRFTFHGYRYVEITGLTQPISPDNVKGLVISSVDKLSSSYETSNPLVNKLWQNITWSLRSNFLSIPTDTPARNERMGWSGDISVFSKSATYLTDANLFLRRHLLAMRDIQPDNGRFTDVAPVGGGFGGTLWGSAGIVVAWETYRQYGDIQLLAEHYAAMKRYIQFLETKVDKPTGILNEGPLGDWLSPEGNKNDNTLFWMAYFAYDLDLISQIATVLGKTDEATQFHQRMTEIKQAWNNIYVDKNTHKTIKSGVKTGFIGPPNQQQGADKSDKGQLIDTQASYAIPLALGVFNEENQPFAKALLQASIVRKNKDDDNIERPPFSLMTGFIGTASINEALSANGSHDLAYGLLVNKEYPSWLYSVVNGATSIWERLNSYTIENGFGSNNSMNSFNHYSFGAVAAWMYNYSLGIQRHPQQAGFKKFILMPTPDPNKAITYAKGYYDSIYGRISSEWKIENNQFLYNTSVPANTSATLYLPANNLSQVTEQGKAIQTWKNVKIENGMAVIPLLSGNYSFVVAW